MPARTAAQGSPHKHEELFRQVADSETFQSAPTMRALLVYLWNHQGEQISEYGIATEALGRSPDFDPKSDSSVRVHIARLRAKLKEFHEAAGEEFPLRLALPLGRHELTVELPAAAQVPGCEAQRDSAYAIFGRLASGACVWQLACVVLLMQNRSLRASVPPAAAAAAAILAVVSDAREIDHDRGSQPFILLLAIAPGVRARPSDFRLSRTGRPRRF